MNAESASSKRISAEDPNPARPARAFETHIAAVTCSGPMS
jgi:hypothetical protein